MKVYVRSYNLHFNINYWPDSGSEEELQEKTKQLIFDWFKKSISWITKYKKWDKIIDIKDCLIDDKNKAFLIWLAYTKKLDYSIILQKVNDETDGLIEDYLDEEIIENQDDEQESTFIGEMDYWIFVKIWDVNVGTNSDVFLDIYTIVKWNNNPLLVLLKLLEKEMNTIPQLNDVKLETKIKQIQEINNDIKQIKIKARIKNKDVKDDEEFEMTTSFKAMKDRNLWLTWIQEYLEGKYIHSIGLETNDLVYIKWIDKNKQIHQIVQDEDVGFKSAIVYKKSIDDYSNIESFKNWLTSELSTSFSFSPISNA